MVARRRLPPQWQVLHASGTRDFEWMLAERTAEPNGTRYLLAPYLDDMAAAYMAADVVVCRAGASTLAELAVTGLPSVLVPYPHATEDHQRLNAQVFVAAGAAVAIDNAALDADSLYWTLTEALDPAKHANMRAAAKGLAHPRALHTIVERILSGRIGKKHDDETGEMAHIPAKGRSSQRT
jgi:UDP-N-acetylglucosamine--N-acetylmuramyl-(pentapeptide) pyrophosphoryl-undecaprenol N-acetylglucosamine transferase